MTSIVSAVILAAGESRRMGTPKLLLPWGETTVLGQVIASFAAGLSRQGSPPANTELVVITGVARIQVEALLDSLSTSLPIHPVFNSGYAQGGMLSSIQVGLTSLSSRSTAALIGLGDQPQVQPSLIRRLCSEYSHNPSSLIIPSFENRRGHPWLVSRELWPELLALPPGATSRQFLAAHASESRYIPADAAILQDLDTPADYQQQRP